MPNVRSIGPFKQKFKRGGGGGGGRICLPRPYQSATSPACLGLNSISDRKKDRWTADKAYKRLQKELCLLRSFILMFLILFKDHISKLKSNPFDCGSKYDLRAVMLFGSLIRECLNDDDFIGGRR